MTEESKNIELIGIQVFRRCCPVNCSYCGFEYEACGTADKNSSGVLADCAVRSNSCVCCGMPYSRLAEILNR